MKNIFIKKPSFEKGNIGDMAIMISLKKFIKNSIKNRFIIIYCL